MPSGKLDGHSFSLCPQFSQSLFLDMLEDLLLAGRYKCLTRHIANEHSGIHGSSVGLTLAEGIDWR